LPADIVSLSALDEERFGVRTGRATAVTAVVLPAVVSFCRRGQVRFLIARCPASDLAAAQAMEAEGFFLTDTLVYWSRDQSLPVPEIMNGFTIRPVRSGEETVVEAIAAEAFRGYFGHYHADPRLDRKACDDTYASWARRSCTLREVAEEVLVAEETGSILGFLTLRRNSPEEAEIVLNGVRPSAQRRGIYRSLVLEAMRWSLDRDCRRLVVSTQLVNVPVQKAWTSLGFTLSSAWYTFHKWFD
jgi:GNAT superfamily N-acetyltransferase